MKEKLLEDMFSLNLVKWALKDAYREASEDFPFLRTTNNVEIDHTVQILETFPKPERIETFVSLVKLYYTRHIGASYAKYVELSSRERELLEVFGAKEKLLPKYTTNLFNLYKNQKFLKIPVKKTKPFILQELNQLMNCIQNDRSGLIYEVYIEKNWLVRTGVNIEKPGISYEHSVLFQSSDETYINENPLFKTGLCISGSSSINEWFGLVGHSGWDFYREEDPIIAAKTLAKLCTHFLNAFPSIIDGII